MRLRTQTLHGPLYYTLSGGDLDECLAAQGLVDISANNLLAIRAKASEPLNITAYTQEGNAASWNYSKFSETTLQMSLTTEFQEFSVADISALSTNGTDAVDFTQSGWSYKYASDGTIIDSVQVGIIPGG